MKKRAPASAWALAFVVLVGGGCFFWWARNRPFYLLFQAHDQIGKEDQASTIANYEKLLSKGGLPKDEEIRLRTALAQFYIKAAKSSDLSAIGYSEDYSRNEIENYFGLSHYSTEQNNSFRTSDAADHPYLVSASRECDRVITLDDKNGFAHYLKGLIYLEKHQARFAAEEFTLSHQYDPNDARPLDFLARVRNGEGKFEEGRKLAVQSLAINPAYDDARLTLIDSLQFLGQFDQAIDVYGKMSPGFLSVPEITARYAFDLAMQGHWREAQHTIEFAEARDPRNGQVKLAYGKILFYQTAYQEAEGKFAQAIDLMPRFLYPVIWQAHTYAMQGQCGEIIRLSQNLEEQSSRSRELRLLLASTALCQGDSARGMTYIDEALHLDPDYVDALETKADILMDQGRYDELGAVLRPLLDKPANQSEAYGMLAESFYSQRKFESAQESAESAIKLNGRYAWPYVWLGLVRAGKKDPDGAAFAFRTANTLNPYDQTIAAYDALHLIQEGQIAEGTSRLRKAGIKASRNPVVWRLLGDVEKSQHHNPEAMDAYQRALDIKPYLLKARLGLIEVYDALHDEKALAAEVSLAFKINSKNPEVLAWRSKMKART